MRADHQGIDLAEYIVIENNADNEKLTTIELKKEAKLGFSLPLAIELGFLTPQLSFKSYQYIQGERGDKAVLTQDRLMLARQMNATAWYSPQHKVKLDKTEQ